MNLVIAAVGRMRAGSLSNLADGYRKRITAHLEIREVEERRKLAAAQMVAREGDLLLAQTRDVATLVALDRRGDDLGSEGFAQALGAWDERGGRIGFIIGGADGLAKDVLTRAHHRIAFGAMTWPHLLARVMLLEQLYRAQQIRAGHPYHRR